MPERRDDYTAAEGRWAVFEDPTLAAGFTQIPNAITRDPSLSMPAKYLYGLILSYAWQDPYSFPGQQRLREHTGAKIDTIRKYIYELHEAGKLEVVRRGRGRTNLYVFKRLTYGSDNPQRGDSKLPPNGVVKTTPVGGHKEYPGDNDSDKEHSRRGADAPPEPKPTNYFEVFCEAAKLLGYEVSPQDRKELPGNLVRLRDSGEHDDTFMRRVVRRCLDARSERQYPLSPQTARDELLNGGAGRPRGNVTPIRDGKPSDVGDGSKEATRNRWRGYEHMLPEDHWLRAEKESGGAGQ